MKIMGKADLHIHTIYSWDGTCSVPAVLKQASHKLHLDVIAITDHDEIAGALEAVNLAPRYGIEVIPGIEISTAEGHLLALFIREMIPAGLPLVDTILRVGKAGGLCIAAHPTARGSSSLSEAAIRGALRNPEAARTLLGIEVYNASIVHRAGNVHARAMARTLPLARTGSSDAHLIWAIGRGLTRFAGRTAGDLRQAIESRSTRVEVGEGIWPAGMILSWVQGYLLRKAGWIQNNLHPEDPVTLARVAPGGTAVAGAR
jgi:hypothetical protein